MTSTGLMILCVLWYTNDQWLGQACVQLQIVTPVLCSTIELEMVSRYQFVWFL